MNKTLTAPNCLIYIIQQTCFKPHYFNSLIQFYCIHKQVGVHCKKTETDDRIIWNFCCIKTKKKKKTAHAQKQECGCPSLQPSLRSHTHAFLADPPR